MTTRSLQDHDELHYKSDAHPLADGIVVGVVSGRYNSDDGWLSHRVWVCRVEDLLPMLDGPTCTRPGCSPASTAS